MFFFENCLKVIFFGIIYIVYMVNVKEYFFFRGNVEVIEWFVLWDKFIIVDW